mmetsp:Transcript_78184/g.198694  ORF Transcript_78184/g.198694 Transcript_78184/m.198694 type:complete len:248 (+) Transcript_78184:53-796(+)
MLRRHHAITHCEVSTSELRSTAHPTAIATSHSPWKCSHNQLALLAPLVGRHGRGSSVRLVLSGRALGELAATGVDVDASPDSDRGLHAVLSQDIHEALHDLPFRRLAAVAAGGVQRNEVDMRAWGTLRDDLAEPPGLRHSVIFAVDKRPLEAHAPAGGRPIVPRGLHELGDRIPSVHRKQLGTFRVGGSVQRDSQSDGQLFLGQPPDLWHEAHGAHSDVAPPDAELLVHPANCNKDIVEVRQGLAHA